MKRLLLAVGLLVASTSINAVVTFEKEELLINMIEDSDHFRLYEMSHILNEAHMWLQDTMYAYGIGIIKLDQNDFDYLRRFSWLIILGEIEYDKHYARTPLDI